MRSRFVMLPSETGSIIIDANQVVSARAKDIQSTIIVTRDRVSLTVAATLDATLMIIGSLRFQVITDGETGWFNHRFLDFASVSDTGPVSLSFGRGAMVLADGLQAETLAETLVRLESEFHQS